VNDAQKVNKALILLCEKTPMDYMKTYGFMRSADL
jgi:hypothetical protein